MAPKNLSKPKKKRPPYVPRMQARGYPRHTLHERVAHRYAEEEKKKKYMAAIRRQKENEELQAIIKKNVEKSVAEWNVKWKAAVKKHMEVKEFGAEVVSAMDAIILKLVFPNPPPNGKEES